MKVVIDKSSERGSYVCEWNAKTQKGKFWEWLRWLREQEESVTVFERNVIRCLFDAKNSQQKTMEAITRSISADIAVEACVAIAPTGKNVYFTSQQKEQMHRFLRKKGYKPKYSEDLPIVYIESDDIVTADVILSDIRPLKRFCKLYYCYNVYFNDQQTFNDVTEMLKITII